VFRRSKSAESSESATVTDKPGGKGRPTPTRKEAEAAARARAKTPRTRREQAAAQRLARAESSQKMRQAMKTGDERYLPARDRGPVRRFIRDFVDSRFSFIELLLPLLLVTVVLGYSGNPTLVNASNSIMFAMLLLVAFDMLLLRFRVRREIVRRFGKDELKGTTTYTLMRAMQMRFTRMPKAQVKIGQSLPESYK